MTSLCERHCAIQHEQLMNLCPLIAAGIALNSCARVVILVIIFSLTSVVAGWTSLRLLEVPRVQSPTPWISQMETSQTLPAHLFRWRQNWTCFWCYDRLPCPLVETIRHSFSNGSNISCRLEGTFCPSCLSASRAGGSAAPCPPFRRAWPDRCICKTRYRKKWETLNFKFYCKVAIPMKYNLTHLWRLTSYTVSCKYKLFLKRGIWPQLFFSVSGLNLGPTYPRNVPACLAMAVIFCIDWRALSSPLAHPPWGQGVGSCPPFRQAWLH